MRDRVRYDEPFGWWGPVWSPPAPRSVLDLIDDGVLSAELAGLLWALLARRASIVVAAGPGGAGKTTLLTALLDFMPPATRRLYVRGCYESFAFLDDPTLDPRRTVLLVNEISAHLPIYLWGANVRRVLAATRAGFAVAATAHAASVEELVYTLSSYPLRVPLTEVAGIDLVVILDAWDEDGAVRREVHSVAALTLTAEGGGGLDVAPLATRAARGAPPALDISLLAQTLASQRGGDEAAFAAEVAERAAALTTLRHELAERTPAVMDAAGGAARVTEAAEAIGRLGARWVAAPGMG